MATFIRLAADAAQRLLARATQVQTANREAQLQRERDARTVPKAKAERAKKRPDTVAPVRGGLWEPAERLRTFSRPVLPEGVALGWVYVGNNNDTPGDEVGFVWYECADRSQRITTSFDYAGVASSRFHVFPVGGDVLIVIHTDAYIGASGTRWQAAVLSRTAVREITVPEAFKTAWDNTTASAISDNNITFAIANYNFSPFFNRMPTDVEENVTEGESAIAGTPGWYPLLINPPTADAIATFNAEGDRGTYAWAKRNFLSALTTPTYGLAQCVRAESCPLGRVDIDKLPTQPIDDEFPSTVDPSEFVPSGVRPFVVATSVPQPSSNYSGVMLPEPGRPIFAWDWGQPSYCRSQLLALGFTAADLTP